MSKPSISNRRRRAKDFAWSFRRSSWRKDTIDNRGAYQLVAGSRTAGTVIDGVSYDADLDQIAYQIEKEERRLA